MIRLVEVLVPVIMLVCIGLFTMGAIKVRSRAEANGNYKRQYMAAAALIDELQAAAVDQAVLSDPFAQIVLDEIRTYRKEHQ